MTPDDVVRHLGHGSDVIVPVANGEPVTLLDAIERSGRSRRRAGAPDARAARSAVPARRTSAIGCATSRTSCPHVTRPCFRGGHRSTWSRTTSARCARSCRERTTRSAGHRRGVAARPPRLLQPRAQRRLRRVVHRAGPVLPRGQPRRCRGRSAATRSTSARSSAGPRPTTRSSRCPRRRSARSTDASPRFVAERIPDGATIQIGIGVDPQRHPRRRCVDHRDLGDPHRADLRRRRWISSSAGVVTGVAKQLNRTKTVGTFALGTQRLYDFLDENTAFELWPVRYVNDPRVIAQERGFVSINATHRRRPARPVRVRDDRRRLLLVERRPGRLRPRRDVLAGRAGLRRAALDDQGRRRSRKIVAQLAAGDVVTTLKNTVDKVVTEWGVAELRGRSIRERAAALIAIAHPDAPRACSPRTGDASATSDRRGVGRPGPMALPTAVPNRRIIGVWSLLGPNRSR